MKKRTVLVILCVYCLNNLFAQDKRVNGDLTVDGTASIGVHISNKWGEGNRLHLRGTDISSDEIWLAKYTGYKERTDLRVNIGDWYDKYDRFVVGFEQWNNKVWNDIFVVGMDGAASLPYAGSKLEVNGTIRSKEVKIEATNWSDFVFNKDYQLPTLQSVEQHINDKGHLPDIPSGKEIIENGVNVVEMQAKLLQKIEELTLYVIDLKKENESIKKELKELREE